MADRWRDRVERIRHTDPRRAREMEGMYRRAEMRRSRDEAREMAAVFGPSRLRMDDCEMRSPEMRGLTESQSAAMRLCYLCGSALPGGRRRWCSIECENTWWTNHSWSLASDRAAQRDGYTCVRCGRRRGDMIAPAICEADGQPWPCHMARRAAGSPHYPIREVRVRIEINHKVPLVGRGYHAGCVHHLDGLESLCHECHVAETTAQIRERRATSVRRFAAV